MAACSEVSGPVAMYPSQNPARVRFGRPAAYSPERMASLPSGVPAVSQPPACRSAGSESSIESIAPSTGQARPVCDRRSGHGACSARVATRPPTRSWRMVPARRVSANPFSFIVFAYSVLW